MPAATAVAWHCDAVGPGDKDTALPPAIHLEAIRKALAENPDATVRLLDGLNHLFQTAVTGSIMEYGMLPEAISADAVALVAEWIRSLPG